MIMLLACQAALMTAALSLTLFFCLAMAGWADRRLSRWARPARSTHTVFRSRPISERVLTGTNKQRTANPREMRTAPLWGLRASAPYLHDGRAATVSAAIWGHDGEAAASRERFLRLSPTQRQQLVDFLNSI
jgi:hypothetical protein